MHKKLQQLFDKRGIKDINELSEEEKTQFTQWQKILSKEELDIKDIKQFCQGQVDLIESKWTDYSLNNSKKAEMIPYHTVYRTLLTAMTSPQVVREQLEEQLNRLIE